MQADVHPVNEKHFYFQARSRCAKRVVKERNCWSLQIFFILWQKNLWLKSKAAASRWSFLAAWLCTTETLTNCFVHKRAEKCQGYF